MRPEHCGFGRSLESLTPGDRKAVEDFRAWLEGRVAYTADECSWVPFTDPRAAIRVCGCRWEPVSTDDAARQRVSLSGHAVKFTVRCDEHDGMCRPLEQWEHEIMEAR